MVVSGLIIGYKVHIDINCNKIQNSVNEFWKNIDEILNAIIFFMMGLILHLLKFNMNILLLGLVAIVLVLIARYIGLFIPFSILKHQSERKGKASLILTWGGLRGGISIALALGISDMEYGDLILLITFCVVFFAIVIQGLTVGHMYKKLFESKI